MKLSKQTIFFIILTVIGIAVSLFWILYLNPERVERLHQKSADITSFSSKAGEQGNDTISYTPFSKKICSGGSCETSYEMKRTYYEENGTWNKINTSFRNNGTAYLAEGNIFKVIVQGNKITIKADNGSEVYFKIPTTNSPIVNDNVISYDVSTGGATKINATIDFTVTPEGIEKLMKIYSISTNQNSIAYSEEFNDTLKGNKFIIGDLLIWYDNTTSWSNGTDNGTTTERVYYNQTWVKQGDSLQLSMNKTWFQNAIYPIYVDPTVYYNYTFNDTINNALGWASPAGASRFSAVTLATPAQYTNVSSYNSAYAWAKSDASNDEPFWRMNFTINETIAQINWLNISFSGYENATEAGTLYVFNWTSNAWVTMGTLGAGTNTWISVNYTGNSISHLINSSNKRVVIVAEGANFDVADGDSVFVDYVTAIVGATDPDTTKPTWSSNATNNTYIGESTNFSVTINDNLALNPNGYYIFSTNNTGVWANDSAVNFTTTPARVNVTKTLNDTANISIGYLWYFFDNVNNSNLTSIFNLITYENTSQIRRCKNLDVENSIYYLMNDIENDTTCINILANNITIQGNGNIINYSNTSFGYGILIDGFNNLTLNNITFKNEINRGNAIYMNNSNYNIVNSTNFLNTGTNTTIKLFNSHFNMFSNNNYSNTASFKEVFIINSSNYNSLLSSTIYSTGGSVEAITNSNSSNMIFSRINFSTSLFFYNENIGISDNFTFDQISCYSSSNSCIGGTRIPTNTAIQHSFFESNSSASHLLSITGTKNFTLYNSTVRHIINSGYALFISNLNFTRIENISFISNTGISLASLNNGIMKDISIDSNRSSISISSTNISNITFLNPSFFTNASNGFASINQTVISGINYLNFNNSYGTINFTNTTFLQNLTVYNTNLSLGTNINISNNSLYINETYYVGENLLGSANVTLISPDLTGITNPRIFKDGVLCTDCYNFTPLDSGIAIFNVSSWSKYNISQYNEGTDTCTYTSGDWNVNCADNCVISSNVNLGGNNILITGTGFFKVDNAIISNVNRFYVKGTDSSNICRIQTINGGKITD